MRKNRFLSEVAVLFSRIKYTLLVITGVFAIAGNAHAQAPDGAKKWSIQDCIDYAAKHNIQVQSLQLNQESAKQDLLAAKGAKIPALSASVGNTFTGSKNDASGDGHLTNQLVSNGTYALNSSVTLWNGNYINDNIRQQNLLVQSAGLTVQQQQNNITLTVAQAFLNILLSKENEKYITDLVSTTNASVNKEQMLVDAGSAARNDLLQLQAQLASDRYLLIQTRNAIRQNILVLKQLLQLSAGTAFDVAIPDSVIIEPELPVLQTVQEKALNTFPEIRLGKLGVNISSLDIAKARAAFKPVLKAGAALGSGYNDVLVNRVNPGTGYLTQTGNNLYQDIGLTLSIPVFSNRVNKVNLEKAKIAYQQAGLNLQNNELALSQAVEQAYLNATNARQSYDAANQQLIAATESYRIANERLKLGAINTYDLLQQRNQYVQAVQDFTQAKYTAVLQQKIYEFYKGDPITL